MTNYSVKSKFKTDEDLSVIITDTASKFKLWLVANPYSLPFMDYLSRLTKVDIRNGLQESPIRFQASKEISDEVKSHTISIRASKTHGQHGELTAHGTHVHHGELTAYGKDARPDDVFQDNVRLIHSTNDHIVLFNTFVHLQGGEGIDDRMLASFTIFPKVLIYETLSNGLSFKTASPSEIIEEHAYTLISDHSHVAFLDVLTNEQWIPSNPKSKKTLLYKNMPKVTDTKSRLFQSESPKFVSNNLMYSNNVSSKPFLYEMQMYFFDTELCENHTVDLHNIIFGLLGKERYDNIILDREELSHPQHGPTNFFTFLGWSMRHITNTNTRDVLNVVYQEHELENNLPEGLLRWYTVDSMNLILRNIIFQKSELMELVSIIATFMNSVHINDIKRKAEISVGDEYAVSRRIFIDHRSVEFKQSLNMTTSTFGNSYISSPELWDDFIIPMLQDKQTVLSYFMGKLYETD